MTSAQSLKTDSTKPKVSKSLELKKFLHLPELQNPVDLSSSKHQKYVATRLSLSTISKITLGANNNSAFICKKPSSISGLNSSYECLSTGLKPDLIKVLNVTAIPPKFSPKMKIQNPASTEQAVCSISRTDERRRMKPSIHQLKVTRPEFIRNSSIELVDSVPSIFSDAEFKSDSSCRDNVSLADLCNLEQTRASQMNTLTKLINQDLSHHVMFPLQQRHPWQRQVTSGPTVLRSVQNVDEKPPTVRVGSVTNTQSILVKRDKSIRDISRLNDSCSPKKKVAFAKNKMVLLFTKET